MNQSNGRVLWIQTAHLATALDSATWLRTTMLLRKDNWSVTLVCEGDPRVTNIDGVDVICIARPHVYFLGPLLFHLRFLLAFAGRLTDYDLLIFHQTSALWLLPLRLLRVLTRAQRPLLVMDTRDLPTLEVTFKNRLRTAYFHLMHRLANRWADGQTAITGNMAKLVAIPEDRLWGIWPSGVETETFSVAISNREWPQQGEPIRLIYIGKLHLERNLLPLCQAVEAAVASGMELELTLVGKGPDQEMLAALARESNGAIRMGQPVQHTEIPALLATAHIGVTSLPPVDDRKYAASSPIKLFEYMAAGLPMLSTLNPCHTDVVGAGRYVFWVEEPDKASILAALEQIWLKRDQLADLSREAHTEVARWSWQAAAEKLSAALAHGLPDTPATAVTGRVVDSSNV